MSSGMLALLGGGSLLVIAIAAKKKIENLQNQVNILSSRVLILSDENSNLENIVRQKDSEINQLKEQLKKKAKKD
ncbi:MAG: hypothetical protein IIA83_09260 [Thaumarchaeota archaeon]|nr:hypothetical protein [Nitrososphaerota archaeon]